MLTEKIGEDVESNTVVAFADSNNNASRKTAGHKPQLHVPNQNGFQCTKASSLSVAASLL